MTLEKLNELAQAAKDESALNRLKDGHNRTCGPGEHKPTSIAAFLRYSAALHELIDQVQYE